MNLKDIEQQVAEFDTGLGPNLSSISSVYAGAPGYERVFGRMDCAGGDSA